MAGKHQKTQEKSGTNIASPKPGAISVLCRDFRITCTPPQYLGYVMLARAPLSICLEEALYKYLITLHCMVSHVFWCYWLS